MKRWLSVPNLRLGFEVLLVFALLLVAFSRINLTQAAPSQAPEVPDAVYWYQCNGPNHIGLFTNRIHIYCTSTTPVSNAPALNSAIFWFAVPTSPDSAAASRFMSLLQTSVITAKPIWLEVNPSDTSGTSFGCGAADCRHIYAVEMR
jgi:hypothetical protein